MRQVREKARVFWELDLNEMKNLNSVTVSKAKIIFYQEQKNQRLVHMFLDFFSSDIVDRNVSY